MDSYEQAQNYRDKLLSLLDFADEALADELLQIGRDVMQAASEALDELLR